MHFVVKKIGQHKIIDIFWTYIQLYTHIGTPTTINHYLLMCNVLCQYWFKNAIDKSFVKLTKTKQKSLRQKKITTNVNTWKLYKPKYFHSIIATFRIDREALQIGLRKERKRIEIQVKIDRKKSEKKMENGTNDKSQKNWILWQWNDR